MEAQRLNRAFAWAPLVAAALIGFLGGIDAVLVIAGVVGLIHRDISTTSS